MKPFLNIIIKDSWLTHALGLYAYPYRTIYIRNGCPRFMLFVLAHELFHWVCHLFGARNFKNHSVGKGIHAWFDRTWNKYMLKIEFKKCYSCHGKALNENGQSVDCYMKSLTTEGV